MNGWPKYDPAKAWVSVTLEHDATLACCRFSPCGKFVVAGGVDGKVHQWELESGKKTSANGHPGWLVSVAIRKDRLLSADLQGTILCRKFPLDGSDPVWTVKDSHRPFLRAMALSPDGKTLVTVGDDRTVRVWDAETGKSIRALGGHKGYVYSVVFHPDGVSIVSGDVLGKVKQWDVKSGTCVRDIDASVLHTRKENFLADVGGVRSIAFDAKGERMACSGLREAKSNTFCPGKPTVAVFDWASGKRLSLKSITGKGDAYVNAARFLPDGLLTGCDETHGGNANVYFWKPDGETQFHRVGIKCGYDLDLHPDGLRLAVASFQGRGRGGNGRNAKRGEYVSHVGAVRIVSLFEKPPKTKKKR